MGSKEGKRQSPANIKTDFSLESVNNFVVKTKELLISCGRRLKYYLGIWVMMSKNSFMIWFSKKLLFSIFLLGKIMRFVFFTGFIYFLVKDSKSLAGYDLNQSIFFFLTFTLVDSISQFFFREVYRFRPLVVSGDFDLILTKPFSSLFRVILGGADFIDLVTLPPLFYAVYYVGSTFNPSPGQIIAYLILLLNGLLIACAFHVFVVSFGIITLEVDHTVMIFRDLSSMGRFPVDIYKQPLRAALTYFVPIGIMMTLPAKVFFGVIDVRWAIASCAFGLAMMSLSLRSWKFALKKYSSASS